MEGAYLGLWSFDTFKAKKKPVVLSLRPLGGGDVDGSLSSLSSSSSSSSSSVSSSSSSVSSSSSAWNRGVIFAQAQNLARDLMETPANWMTPRLFCDRAEEVLRGAASASTSSGSNPAGHPATTNNMLRWTVHDEQWAKRQGMNAFLSVAQGSQEPLRFLEIHYHNPAPAAVGVEGAGTANAEPPMDLALVGKGVT